MSYILYKVRICISAVMVVFISTPVEAQTQIDCSPDSIAKFVEENGLTSMETRGIVAKCEPLGLTLSHYSRYINEEAVSESEIQLLNNSPNYLIIEMLNGNNVNENYHKISKMDKQFLIYKADGPIRNFYEYMYSDFKIKKYQSQIEVYNRLKSSRFLALNNVLETEEIYFKLLNRSNPHHFNSEKTYWTNLLQTPVCLENDDRKTCVGHIKAALKKGKVKLPNDPSWGNLGIELNCKVAVIDGDKIFKFTVCDGSENSFN